MDERRSTIRVPVGMEGTYQLLGDLSGPRLGLTQDISLGGVRLASAERLPPGEKVSISLNLPRAGAVSMTGVVLWSREMQEARQQSFEAGLRWLDVDAHTQARLNAFITEYTRARSITVETGGVPLPPPMIVWPRALALAAGLFFLGSLLTAFWIRQLQLQIELDSLRGILESYEQLLTRLR